jgi:Fur family transcriptional regulator, ferric uptake regulator
MATDQSKTSRMTRQQMAILDVLGNAKKFYSAQQIYGTLVRRNKDVALATVYRTLKALSEAGEVDVIFSDGEALYRRCKTADHHHHLVCRDCGTSIEIENPDLEAWAARVAEEHGFEAVGHTLELYGTCRRCCSRP